MPHSLNTPGSCNVATCWQCAGRSAGRGISMHCAQIDGAEARPMVLAGLVLTETLLGVRDGAQAARVARALLAFELTPELTRSDYEQAAAIYRACRARGTTPRSTIDCLIAQICLRYDHELLSRDRDFDAIARIFPLQRVAPAPGVQEQARLYYSPGRQLTPRRASAPRRSSRA
ncbi:MAG: PIN domain nuclease [Gammaproteobacteria bacterium]|nr:MAG: PIN domain nuclease [Gammaproteobacteria bacterium]